MKSEKRIKKYVFVCLVVVSAFFAIMKLYTYNVTTDTIAITASGDHPANYHQYDASVRMFVWDGQLYFYSYGGNTKAQFYRELCVFEDQSVKSLGKMAFVYALQDGYVYYSGDEVYSKLEVDLSLVPWNFSETETLMCLDLSTNQQTALSEIKTFSWHDLFLDADGTCYIPDNSNIGMYYTVEDGTISGPTEMSERYTLGSNQYTIENHDLVRYSSTGDREILKEFKELGSPCILPCENGLLIYNHGATDLLYFIPSDTESMVEFLVFNGFATISAVNVYQDWAYVSFKRYIMGEHGLEKYKTNDEMEGTYRISLTDYSSEKLSDIVYNGLYIFDNEGMYACDGKGGIFKLDFDGNVIMTLMG